MSQSSTTARPRQVTMAGGLAVGGSVFLLLSVFDSLGRISSIDTREAVVEAMDSGGAGGLGLSVDAVLSAMQVGLWVTAVCAAVTLVCGVFVFSKDRGARVALTVATVPMALFSLLTGLVMAVLMVAAVTLLWSGPSRDWFAGRPVRELPTRQPKGRSQDQPDAVAPRTPDHVPAPPAPSTSPGGAGTNGAEAPRPAVSTATTSTMPRPTEGYGERPAAGDPTAPGGPWSSTPGADARAPSPVRTAALLTWVTSALVLLALPFVVWQFRTNSDQIMAEVDEMGMLTPGQVTPQLLETSVWIFAVVLGVWAVGAMVLAWLVMRRHDWARYLLLTSAVGSLLLGLLAFPAGLVVAAASGGAAWLLLRPASRRWFAGPGPGRTPPPPPPPPSQSSAPPPSQQGRPGPW